MEGSHLIKDAKEVFFGVTFRKEEINNMITTKLPGQNLCCEKSNIQKYIFCILCLKLALNCGRELNRPLKDALLCRDVHQQELLQGREPSHRLFCSLVFSLISTSQAVNEGSELWKAGLEL